MRGDRLVRLDGSDRILSSAECEAIARRVFAMAKGGGDTRVFLSCWWQGELRWGRNRVTLASDRRAVSLGVARGVAFNRGGYLVTNQLDDGSIEAAVRAAERFQAIDDDSPPPTFAPPLPTFPAAKTALWSDATYNLSAEARGEVARAITEPAEQKGMLSAGYIEVRAAARAEFSSAARAGQATAPELPYAAWTQAQCSMTVRDIAGTGSGWAGLSSYDWARIDVPSLAATALDKSIRSRNPVRLEPGRYTVILEPQAVADLVSVLVWSLDRERTERGDGPFVLGGDDALDIVRTKLGLKIVDERVTISHDFLDPDLGVVSEWGNTDEPVTWIRNGVLEAMWYDRAYALSRLAEGRGLRRPLGFRMSGGSTTVDEMIKTTKRGLLVTRFDRVRALDPASLLCTGLTRDGLWLVENGQITKPVKNFRFTESPLFVLNSLEQLGPPVRVFTPTDANASFALTPAIVPPVKARDFSFTSLVDAV